MYKTNILSLPW